MARTKKTLNPQNTRRFVHITWDKYGDGSSKVEWFADGEKVAELAVTDPNYQGP